MAPYFYLSYARADRHGLVKRFHDDLSDTIRIRSGNSKLDPMGFYEDTTNNGNSEWTTDSKEALRTSAVLLPLLSPSYVWDENAGRQWQVFEMRYRLLVRQLLSSKLASPKNLESVIAPVNWIGFQGPVPEIVSKTRVFEGYPTRANENQPILTMLESMSTSARTYSKFIRSLADHVIERAEATHLPPLISVPPVKDIPNLFFGLDEVDAKSRPFRNTPSTNKLFLIDGTLVRKLADQIDETAERIGSSAIATVFEGSQRDRARHFGQERIQERNQQPMRKYNVWVIEDVAYMRDIIEENLLLTGLFDVTTYEDPKTLLSHFNVRSFNNQETPDLFVIDLILKGKEIQGLELISELSRRRDFRSAIVAISGYARIGELLDAVGAGADWPMTKPFSDDFVGQLQRCAEIGRNRRLYNSRESQLDESRKERPVFLSYSVRDTKPGNLLRRNLEARGIDVWYAPNVLEPGDEWRERIRQGLSQTRVLVALITKEYVNSAICKAELITFLRRVTSEVDHPPLLILVFYECSPSVVQQDELLKKCLRYQYIEMSDETFVDGLTALYWKIKNFLERDHLLDTDMTD